MSFEATDLEPIQATLALSHYGDTEKKAKPQEIAVTMLAGADEKTRRGTPCAYLYDQRSEDFYRWDGERWTMQLKDTMEQRAYQFDTFEHCSHKRVTETLKYLKACVGKADIEWDALPNGYMPLKKGLLRFDGETPQLLPHDKDKHYTYNLDLDFDPEATSPTWTAALERWLGGSPDSEARKAALQEYMGYCLLAHAKYKKALMLVGESNTGKSRVEAAIRMLVGQKLCTSVRLEAFNTSRFPFGLEDLLGKQVNFISEPSKGDLLNDGMFKQVVSGSDAVTVHRKNQKGVTTVLRAKHVIATNVMPIVKDESKGTWNRLLVIPFENVIPASEQDPDFDEKLREELPGLLNWCIEGAKRLVANRGKFTYVPSGEELAQEHRSENNPLSSFVETHLKDDAMGTLTSAEILSKFVSSKMGPANLRPTIKQVEGWLEQLGFEAMPGKVDGQDLRARATIGGKRVKVKRYQGIAFKQYGF